jgi:hypothetical protein
LPEQAPTDRWWPGAAGVPNAPFTVAGLIGRFQDLFQFDKGIADMITEIDGLFGNVDAAFGS